MVDMRPGSRNGVVVGALFAFIGFAFAVPFCLATTTRTVDEKGRLHGAAARRGAYLNSGSRDIGPREP